uniref:STAS domain-containing protein n=1 Tax=Soboliphyme baturini TaxID=241478 RepID=A0A183IYU7_9BILA
MGFLSVYLSKQLVQGLTTGAAVLVFLSQVGPFFGINGLPKIGNPFEVFKIIIFTAMSYILDMKKNYRVAIVGYIPEGLIAPVLPKWSLFFDLISDAISISIVTYAIAVSMAKLFAEKHGYRISPNQEWFAMGLVHILSSFFACHCSSASLSRSLVQDQQGGRTQCVFAAIIIVALRGMFLQFRELPLLWKKSKIDFYIWIFSFTSVVVLDLTYGLAASICFAVMTIGTMVRMKFYRVSGLIWLCILGHTPCVWGMFLPLSCTAVLRPAARRKHYIAHHSFQVKELIGIKIYRFDSPLSFANVEVFKNELYRKTEIDPVLYKKERARKNESNVSAVRANDFGFFKFANAKHADKHEADETTQLKSQEDSVINHTDNGPLKYVIIDCSSFSYIDLSGAETLKKLHIEYGSVGITLRYEVSFRNADFMKKFLNQASSFRYTMQRYSVHTRKLLSKKKIENTETSELVLVVSERVVKRPRELRKTHV